MQFHANQFLLLNPSFTLKMCLKHLTQGNSEMTIGKEIKKDGNKPAGKSERGFAAMDPTRQREIASAGGKAAHQSGNAHEFTSEEARKAGRKGGQASSKQR